jgi:peptidoglycan/LPS O-acetylase OafA/YrhL
MRGLAAIGVVLFHLTGNLQPEIGMLLPDVLSLVISYGYLGVPIFFVVSGFVISLGVGSTKVTMTYAGNFVMRRSIRLDLVYWASIFMALSLIQIKNQVTGSQEEVPSAFDILLNMFYLQELLSVKPVISVVYWTLCLEVQFYLFYIFSLWLTQSVFKSNSHVFHTIAILILGIYSILLDLGIVSIEFNGLFISNWHYFLMGILVSRVVRGGNYSVPILVTWILIEVIFQISVQLKAYVIAGIGCSLSIFFMWKFKKLNTYFTGRIFTYLGTISYSLYLVHPDIGWKAISFGRLVIGDSLSPLAAGLLLIFGLTVSIAVAHVFHFILEKPTLHIATRLKSEPLSLILKSILSSK